MLKTLGRVLGIACLCVLLSGCDGFSPAPDYYPSSGDPPACATERLEKLIRDSSPNPDSVVVTDSWIIRNFATGYYGLTMLFSEINHYGKREKYEAYGPIDQSNCHVFIEEVYNHTAFDEAILGTATPSP